MELQITKAELLEKLQTEAVSVTFTKVDGSERTMLCTKMVSKIPEAQHPKTEKAPKLDENGNVIETDLITVYDLEKEGWRSFNFTKVTNIQ
jgi:hypothetical protein